MTKINLLGLALMAMFLTFCPIDAIATCSAITQTSTNHLDFSAVGNHDPDTTIANPDFQLLGDEQYLDCIATDELEFNPKAIAFRTHAVTEAGTTFGGTEMIVARGGAISLDSYSRCLKYRRRTPWRFYRRMFRY